MIAAIVLTYNSEASIKRTLVPLLKVANTIHVVDSHSTDRTVEICLENGCDVVTHEFLAYSKQRNWSIARFAKSAGWQLHVDADEELDDELISNIRALDLDSPSYDGFIFARRIVFMNRVLRFGGISKTWHMRLFRSRKGRVEDRMYDQHFICSGTTRIIRGNMFDHQEQSLSEWTTRHNRWSDLEAREFCFPRADQGDTLKGKFRGNVIERKSHQKNIYYKMPLFVRAMGYFVFRYIFLLGMLDGRRGLVYHVLQGFWFRFVVDAKIYEYTVGKSLPERDEHLQ
jgi:glycosyltransferase involved in cell wall biosynthesis